MKQFRYALLGISFATAAWLALSLHPRMAVADEQITAPTTRSGSFLSDEFELRDEDWADDFAEESKDGSPVRPGKVAICHKGMTIIVSQPAVPHHLAHGDTLGPCGPKTTTYTVVCHQGKTLVVSLAEAAGHVHHGDKLGMCTGEAGTIMCDGSNSHAVAEADVQKRVKDGWKMGACNGTEAVVMCSKNKTIVVPKDKVEAHKKAGDTLGACPNQPKDDKGKKK